MDQDADGPEVRPPTIEDVCRICRSLEEAGARYVLIGGFAVADRQTLIRTKRTIRPSLPRPFDVCSNRPAWATTC